MPAERVSMRKIREALRLTHALGMSRRLVGEATGIGKTAVGEYVRRAAVAGLSWPIADEIDDAELERRLFPPATTASCAARTEPDWPHIHAELKRRGVTLALLWQEYRVEHAQGYAYSWFCERHSDWRKRISATMRQTHLAGEKLFVDWAGDTMPVFNPTTGEEHRAYIFVAALGASNYTYAEARWTETLPDWIGAHVNALAAIGGVPKAFVPDNLKAGITKPSRYWPSALQHRTTFCEPRTSARSRMDGGSLPASGRSLELDAIAFRISQVDGWAATLGAIAQRLCTTCDVLSGQMSGDRLRVEWLDPQAQVIEVGSAGA
jgi:transposase